MSKPSRKVASREQIITYLASLGFPLITKGTNQPSTDLVYQIIESKDARLIGLLPFILLEFSINPKDAHYINLKNINSKILSNIHSVYHTLKIETPFIKEIEKILDIKEPSPLSSGEEKEYRNLFELYQKRNQNIALSKERSKQELAFQYHLSTLFPPKQKEIILKKLKNKPLTKTEREYFARVIKKNLSAIADSKIFDIARKLITN